MGSVVDGHGGEIFYEIGKVHLPLKRGVAFATFIFVECKTLVGMEGDLINTQGHFHPHWPGYHLFLITEGTRVQHHWRRAG
jgi:hypothetical protein